MNNLPLRYDGCGKKDNFLIFRISLIKSPPTLIWFGKINFNSIQQNFVYFEETLNRFRNEISNKAWKPHQDLLSDLRTAF